MAFWHVNREDIDAYLMGMSTYGTGGGGNPETGRALLNAGLDNGRVFNMVDPMDVPDDAVICSGGIMGSVRRLSDEEITDPESSAKMLVKSIRTMEQIQGKIGRAHV